MIFDYPKIMKNELFFAYALRFHKYSGNLNIANSFREFFQRDSWPQTTMFLKCPADALSNIRLSATDFIEQHTIIPFYRVFLPEKQFHRITAEEIVEQPYKICFMLPKKSSHIKENNQYLWYCPVCHSIKRDYSDIQRYHQVPETHVCAKHHCYLKKISIKNRDLLDRPDKWDVDFENCDDGWLNGIAEDIKYILDVKPRIFVDSFAIQFWNYIEKHDLYFQIKLWEERLKKRLANLPEQYGNVLHTFCLRKYLNLSYNADISILEYLIMTRGVFGEFQSFIDAF